MRLKPARTGSVDVGQLAGIAAVEPIAATSARWSGCWGWPGSGQRERGQDGVQPRGQVEGAWPSTVPKTPCTIAVWSSIFGEPALNSSTTPYPDLGQRASSE